MRTPASARDPGSGWIPSAIPTQHRYLLRLGLAFQPGVDATTRQSVDAIRRKSLALGVSRRQTIHRVNDRHISGLGVSRQLDAEQPNFRIM